MIAPSSSARTGISGVSYRQFPNFPTPSQFKEHWDQFVPFSSTELFTEKLQPEDLEGCDCLVDVSVSSSERFVGEAASREHLEMPLEVFLKALRAAEREDVSGTVFALEASPQWYLSQVPLFSSDSSGDPVEPSLRPLCLVPRFPPPLAGEELLSVNMWMNIHRARSSLHYDAYHNFLTIHKGCKSVTLYPPNSSRFIGLRPACSLAANHGTIPFSSQLDGSRMWTDMGRIDVVLGEGDCLFIPEGWWHEVASEPLTVAVVIYI